MTSDTRAALTEMLRVAQELHDTAQKGSKVPAPFFLSESLVDIRLNAAVLCGSVKRALKELDYQERLQAAREGRHGTC